MPALYHCSAWEHLCSLKAGDRFTLRPGTQNAEGVGVYFSEGAPSSASDSCHLAGGVSAIVAINAGETAPGWWRSKASHSRKYGKPRTWHTAGREITLRIVGRAGNILFCRED